MESRLKKNMSKIFRGISIVLIIIVSIICFYTMRESLISKYDNSDGEAIILNNSDILKGTPVDYIENSGVRIPILSYSLINDSGEPLSLSKATFESHIKWLNDNGFTFLSAKEAYEMITTGNNVPKRPVVISFEDGYDDVFVNAYPILQKYDAKATVFISSDNINEESYLNESMMKTMHENGISFQGHSKDNKKLQLLNYDEQYQYLKESKERIEGILNNKVEILMYPYGSYDEDTIAVMDKLGYKMGIGNRYGYAREGNGIYNVRRIKITINNKDINNFKDLFNGIR